MPGDVESEGESNINLGNNPELRWSFIRKVYSIIIFQLLLIITVVSVVRFVHPVANFFNSKQGTFLYTVLILIPLIGLGSIDCYYYLQKYPLNYFLLLIFGVSSALPVGLTCVFADGETSLEIVILSTIMMFFLTLYTFWAEKRDHDISLLNSFLFGAFSILIFFGFIQILFVPSGIPLKKLLTHIFGCVVSIIFCGCTVNYTDYYTKAFTYHQHIMAFVLMYLVLIVKFFIPLLILRYI